MSSQTPGNLVVVGLVPSRSCSLRVWAGSCLRRGFSCSCSVHLGSFFFAVFSSLSGALFGGIHSFEDLPGIWHVLLNEALNCYLKLQLSAFPKENLAECWFLLTSIVVEA